MTVSWYVWLAMYFLQILTPSIYGSVSYDGSINISEAYSTCSKEWFEYGGLCYKVGGTNKNRGVDWASAAKACKEEKGLLATVYDQDISDFLSAHLLVPAQEFLWIGLDDRVTEGVYKWTDGTPYNFTNYRRGEPNLNHSDEEDCTEMDYRTNNVETKAGQWNDRGCDRKLGYICQKAKESQDDKPYPQWISRNNGHHLDPRYCMTEKGLGWRFEESCFFVVPEKKNWAQAENHCAKEYKGHLATLDYKVNYLINYVFRDVTEEMWIGIKIKAETQQKWSSGWLVTFENWAEQEKFKFGTCVLRDASGAWIIQPCEKELWFICEHSTSKAIPPVLKSSVENARCPKMPRGSQGWRDIGGDFCYFFGLEADVPWDEASSNCVKRGGTLASIHSQEEYDIVTLFVRYYPYYSFYIGLYRPTKNATEFVWLDGSPVNFTRWYQDQPDNKDQQEQCTELWQKEMLWADGACTKKMGYICSTQKNNPQDESKIRGKTVDFLSAFLIMPAQSFLWIGLNDRVTEGDYKWADGTPYSFTNFRPYQPDPKNKDEEDCIEMDYRTGEPYSKIGQWGDLNCSYGFPYICQRSKESQVDKSDPQWMSRNNEHHLDPRYCKTEKGLGWRFEESCFFVVPEKKSWTQAENHCAKEYKGHLATLDYRVNYFINYVFREVTEEMWIGVKIKAETQQKWSSGWLVSFENWAEQEKFVYGTCVSRDASGGWVIQPCEKELWFICEHSTSKEMPPIWKPFVEVSHCPTLPQGSQGWRDIGGDFCYFFALQESVSWYEGNYNCMKRGGTLAIIHSQAEHDIVLYFIQYYKYWRFHIGFYRSTKDANEFVWVDGSPVNFTRWTSDEPNNLNQKEQCTELVVNDMAWNDGECNERMGYICSTQKIYSY